MPSGNRDDKTISITYQARRDLGNLFVEYLQSKTNTPVKLIAAELDDTDSKLTQDILKEVKALPGVQITQLIGSDGFLAIRNRLTDAHEMFIVMNRHDHELPAHFSHAQVIGVFDGTSDVISSTQIRTMVKNHDTNYRNLVPNTIATYIEQNKLYTRDT